MNMPRPEVGHGGGGGTRGWEDEQVWKGGARVRAGQVADHGLRSTIRRVLGLMLHELYRQKYVSAPAMTMDTSASSG